MAPQAKDGARPGAAAPARLKAKIKIAQSPANGTVADRNGISNSQSKVPTPPPAPAHVQVRGDFFPTIAPLLFNQPHRHRPPLLSRAASAVSIVFRGSEKSKLGMHGTRPSSTKG
jgi:hypothetical protein